MGNCFGRCLTSGRNGLRHSTDEQESVELVQEEDDSKENNFIYKIIKFKRKKNRPQFIEKFWTEKESNYRRLNLQEQPVECSEIQLQCLDANNLLRTSPATTTSLDVPQKLSKMKFNQFSCNKTNNHYTTAYHHDNCFKNHIYSPDNPATNINSSRASSSLDLEWEHEYGNVMQRHNIIENINETKNLNESWYFIQSSDDEFLTSKRKSHHVSNQQLLNMCNDDGDDDNDDDDDAGNRNNIDDNEYAIDVVNCIDTKLIKFNNSIENSRENLFHKNINNCFTKTISKSLSICTTTNIYDGLQEPCNMKCNRQQQQQQQQQTNYVRTPSRTSWSHISTPESLEWDIDEEQQKQLRVEDDNLDHETLELLHEIELLKNKVLNETGTSLLDENFKLNWKMNNS